MKFDVLTIFPEMVSANLQEGILGRAVKRGIVDVRIVNIRNFARGAHRSTDDRPYGGGDGMVMRPGPISRALESIDRVRGRSHVILLSPQGEKFDQETAWELSRWNQIVLICGRYEGVDERIRLTCIERELSIGDYVLSGGELAALVVMGAVSRLSPGVLGGGRDRTWKTLLKTDCLNTHSIHALKCFKGKRFLQFCYQVTMKKFACGEGPNP